MCEKLFEQLEDVADAIDRCVNEIQTISARIEKENCAHHRFPLGLFPLRLFSLQPKDPSHLLAGRVKKLERLVTLFTQASRGLKRSYVDINTGKINTGKAWEEVMDDTWLYSRFLEEVIHPKKPRVGRSAAVDEQGRLAVRIA